MARGRDRWTTKAERQRMPLPSGRPAEPRTDGAYVTADGTHRVVFAAAGAAELDGQPARWSVAADQVRIASEAWDAEGALGTDTLQLLSSRGGDHREREAWRLEFRPG